MVRKNLPVFIVIFVSALVVSFLLKNLLAPSEEERVQTVESVEPISEQFDSPNSRIFNDSAVNPTELIEITEGTGSTPFIIDEGN